jgi:hypothetical protein
VVAATTPAPSLKNPLRVNRLIISNLTVETKNDSGNLRHEQLEERGIADRKTSFLKKTKSQARKTFNLRYE